MRSEGPDIWMNSLALAIRPEDQRMSLEESTVKKKKTNPGRGLRHRARTFMLRPLVLGHSGEPS